MANVKARKKTEVSKVSVGIISRALGLLSNQLLALAEDPDKWSEISEKIRQELLVKLHSKKPKQVKGKTK